MMPSTFSYASALLVVLTATLLYATLLRFRKMRSLSPKSLEEMMAMGADKAVARANSRYGTTLDFSVDSLRRIDSVLERVHQEFTAAPRLVDVNSLAFVFGAYIGETIRRNQPKCAWERNHAEAGENSYPLHWGEATCFPIGWCVRRIHNGEEENIWKNYELVSEMAAGRGEAKGRAATAG